MAKEQKNIVTNNDCFVIMPIAEPDGYDKGHFRKVYEDILKVACEKAGFNPVRADEVKQTNLIHLDILQKLIDSPIAICDLSNRNPNVLFELGLRQAFDKPTVLVQEVGTPKIFDISPLRYTEYRKELKYREVLEDQGFITEALKATKQATENGEGVNSIISLLSLSSPASLKEVTDNDAAKMLQIVMSEMNDLRADFRKTLNRNHEIVENLISLDNGYEVTNVFRAYQPLYKFTKNNFQELKLLMASGEPFESVKAKHNTVLNNLATLINADLPSNIKNNAKNMILELEVLFNNYLKDN